MSVRNTIRTIILESTEDDNESRNSSVLKRGKISIKSSNLDRGHIFRSFTIKKKNLLQIYLNRKK